MIGEAARDDDIVDLLVVGGGINGCGIARDAVGRGLSVALVEQGDIAGATSQWSTKLIHGGLRYLEYYEFRLVREALQEREVLLAAAPHLIQPLEFVLPHEPHLRPRWMIRAGLFLYDLLGGRTSLPRSRGVALQGETLGAGLKPGYARGFSYFDARVDDARLTLANARAAADLGAQVMPRMRLVGARASAGIWTARLEDVAHGHAHELRARAIVNAAGPWVMRVIDALDGVTENARVRHVKGSHIVVPRLHEGEHAYILQNPDGRIIFIIPYLGRYSLIGTTDVAVDAWEAPEISDEERDYLCAMASTYTERPVLASDVVWSYSGVRPLFDDGAGAAAAVTRDYVLRDQLVEGAPVLSIFGGKLTTYRCLSEHVLDRLKPHFPAMGASWTRAVPLPGGDFTGGLDALVTAVKHEYPFLPQDHVIGMARRHGSQVFEWLEGCASMADLGEHFGAGLYAREVEHMVACEWAMTADDVLYRRSKTGLMMDAEGCARLARYLESRPT